MQKQDQTVDRVIIATATVFCCCLLLFPFPAAGVEFNGVLIPKVPTTGLCNLPSTSWSYLTLIKQLTSETAWDRHTHTHAELIHWTIETCALWYSLSLSGQLISLFGWRRKISAEVQQIHYWRLAAPPALGNLWMIWIQLSGARRRPPGRDWIELNQEYLVIPIPAAGIELDNRSLLKAHTTGQTFQGPHQATQP